MTHANGRREVINSLAEAIGGGPQPIAAALRFGEAQLAYFFAVAHMPFVVSKKEIALSEYSPIFVRPAFRLDGGTAKKKKRASKTIDCTLLKYKISA